MNICKRYSLLLMWLTVLLFATLAAVSLYLQPLSGDLTRLGWYSERHFGWNKPQKAFATELFSREDAYRHYADVVVIGDSFSIARYGYQWQNFFVAETGLSVATFVLYADSLKFNDQLLPQIVHSEAFQKTPPRVVVFQKVERMLDQMGEPIGDCRPGATVPAGFSVSMKPSPADYPLHNQFRKTTALSRQSIAYAAEFLDKRVFSLRKKFIVTTLALENPELFSNRQSDKLLLIDLDIKKRSWDEHKIDKIRCILLAMQNLVQANRKTLFVAMLAPDKLTAYSRQLADKGYVDLSVFDKLAAEPSLNLLRLDWALRSAVDKGMVDVYLPNDTHWGYQGHRIAATTLAQYLRERSGD